MKPPTVRCSDDFEIQPFFFSFTLSHLTSFDIWCHQKNFRNNLIHFFHHFDGEEIDKTYQNNSNIDTQMPNIHLYYQVHWWKQKETTTPLLIVYSGLKFWIECAIPAFTNNLFYVHSRFDLVMSNIWYLRFFYPFLSEEDRVEPWTLTEY